MIPRRRNAFTLIEMLVVIAIIGMLMAILAPAVMEVRTSSRITLCGKRLGNIAAAIRQADSSQAKVRADNWPSVLWNYMDEEEDEDAEEDAPLMRGFSETFHCPDHIVDVSDTPELEPSFGMNNRYVAMKSGDSEKIVMLDYKKIEVNVVGSGSDDWNDWYDEDRHRGDVNVLFYDDHVELLSPDALDPEVCEIHDIRWRPLRDSHLKKPNCKPQESVN